MTNDVGTFRGKKALHFKPVAFASAAALCLGWTTAASSEPVSEVNRTRYEVLQSFSQEFGSKFASGYFVSKTGKCLVTLMLAEKSNSDVPHGETAARVRLTLDPGQVAGLDSEEGQSLNIACGESATALIVAKGNREPLMADRKDALSSSADVDWSVYRQW